MPPHAGNRPTSARGDHDAPLPRESRPRLIRMNGKSLEFMPEHPGDQGRRQQQGGEDRQHIEMPVGLLGGRSAVISSCNSRCAIAQSPWISWSSASRRCASWPAATRSGGFRSSMPCRSSRWNSTRKPESWRCSLTAVRRTPESLCRSTSGGAQRKAVLDPDRARSPARRPARSMASARCSTISSRSAADDAAGVAPPRSSASRARLHRAQRLAPAADQQPIGHDEAQMADVLAAAFDALHGDRRRGRR